MRTMVFWRACQGWAPTKGPRRKTLTRVAAMKAG
jgi:hypothetical protein